ncbi:jmjC domain-containing protein 8-like [Halichondria panicea]|uniref:jmjC domain-containing protein 8-like n=1 Tax=Halichondria panicea TaxID=6063 RepID=UPI00312BA132
MARTCTTSFLYLVLVLLPQMLWLHHSNHGLVVCEACGSVMEAALNNRAKAPPPSHVSDQCTSELPCSDDAAYQELSEEESDYTRMNDTHYPSLCSCSVAGAEGKVSDVYSDAPNGGWSSPGGYPDLSGPCTIRRVEASSLTQRDFEWRFAYTEPVIITGLPGQSDFRAGCSKYRLLKEFGHDIITVATANTHSYRKEKVSLCDYVETMMAAQTLTTLGNETLYYFGDNNREDWSSLFSLYTLPPYHVPDTTPVLSFGLAGPGSGVPFHIHGPTFAETVYGRKRWFLYPPPHSPHFDPDQTTLHWLKHTYPQLVAMDTERPLECTLQPGEVIYFPDKWWHATLNLDTAVFMSTFYS